MNRNTRTSARKLPYFSIYRMVFIGVMAAVVYVVTMFPFPLFGSKIHFGNTMSILAGLLFGPVSGGLASGISSMIYDLTHGYPIWEALITLVSKFLMSFVAGLLGYAAAKMPYKARYSVFAVIGSVVGAWTYVALYMLKHFVLQLFVYQAGWEATVGVMLSKLPASAINAVFAMIVAPILWHALRPVLLHMPAYKKVIASGRL